MKRLIATLTVALIAAAGTFAQESDAPFLERLGVPEDQIEAVLEIQQETEEETRVLRAELDLLRARLTRELVEPEPDRQEIRNILRESVEWEYQLRLARVEAELDIREVVGDRTWGRIVQARERQRQPQGPGRN